MGHVSASEFRTVMGRFATGVSVMTSVCDGTAHGMTANSVASVSLVPPLVLVCVRRETVMETLVGRSGVFALSFLSAWTAHLEHFANPLRPAGQAQFESHPLGHAAAGAPILRDCIAWVDCSVWATYGGGDHSIVVGEVVDAGPGNGAQRHRYFHSNYRTLEAADSP